MIRINNEILKKEYFPDNTLRVRKLIKDKDIEIEWLYENDEEMAWLYKIKDQKESHSFRSHFSSYSAPGFSI